MKTIASAFPRLMPFTAFILLAVLISANALVARQADEDPQSASAICTFDDGKQMSARYNPIAVGRNEGPPVGRVWIPGGSAITLFADTDFIIGNASIPAGAYTIYLVPGKKDWTLIVSRNVIVDGRYDATQDLVRAVMETGTLSQAEDQLKVSFGHFGPKQCEMNVDYGKSRAWVEFREK